MRPQIRTDLLTLFAPSNYSLYSARSATQWAELGGSTPVVESPSLVISREHFNDAKITSSDAFHTLLHVLHLSIQDAHYRMRVRQSRANQPVVLTPWSIYAESDEDRWLLSNISSLYPGIIRIRPGPEPRCLILWHSACIALAANVQLFELALKPAALRSSATAMSQVAVWAQSAAARRACLHGGEIFSIIWHRRTSEVVNFHTALSLFRAALVFGMYVMHNVNDHSSDARAPLELIDSFSWGEIGQSGLEGGVAGSSENHAKSFISHGGLFSISGDVYSPGLMSARRVLLHFADLMENLGKAKSRRFARILHIIAEDLTEVEQTDDEGSDAT